MKKLTLFTLFFLSSLVTSVLSDELVLTTNNCKSEEYVNQLNLANTHIYMCDTEIDNVKLSSVVNYFYNDSCLNGYSELPDLFLYVNENTVSACTPLSLDIINENTNYNDRVRFYKGSCSLNQKTLFSGDDQFAACLNK